jgi:hypothetical protein
MTSLSSELLAYVGHARAFGRRDWALYLAWVGLMLGLTLSTGTFLLWGLRLGVQWPAVAYLVPIGAAIFTVSIAVDTIGHRTIYKEAIAGAEGLVHGITIFCGVASCVLLCAAFRSPDALWVPAMVLTVLSFVYSLVDEAFHWRRYVRERADRVEMCSHVGIFVGHGTMMLGWWAFFFAGYPGVAATLARGGWS